MKKLHKNFYSTKQTIESMASDCSYYCSSRCPCSCPDIPSAAGMPAQSSSYNTALASIYVVIQ
jgi:putative bacteriocin precursor